MKASKKLLLTLPIAGAIGITSAYAVEAYWTPGTDDTGYDWQTHYVCYDVKSPVYKNERTEVTIYNQFTYQDGQKLYIGDARYLCVPTKKVVPSSTY